MKETIKKWYNDEKFIMWYHNNSLVRKFVQNNIISEEDYTEITGEDY